MSDKSNSEQPEIMLEAPPTLGTPSVAPLLESGKDSLAVVSAKAAALESFLTLSTRDLTFADFTRELLLTVMKVVRCEAGTLFELDPANACLFFRAIAGKSSDKLSGFTVPLGQGVVGHVAESRLPLSVSDAGENSIHLKSIQKAVGFEARNLVALPIVIRGDLYGVLELLNRTGEPEFSEADIGLLSYLCEMAAKAIEVRLNLAWALRHGGEGRRGQGEAA